MSELSAPEQIVRHIRVLEAEMAGALILGLATVIEIGITDKPAPALLGSSAVIAMAGTVLDVPRRGIKIFRIGNQAPQVDIVENNL